MLLVPKNWKDFQHYRDRCPPWIKLHKDLLNDRAFITLPLASKALAPMMWLLASEHKDGIFDASVEELAFRLRMSESDIASGLKPLLEKEFFLDGSTMLATCLQDATTERETEAETKKEVKNNKPPVEAVDFSVFGMSDVDINEIKRIRKQNKGGKITQRVANGLAKEFQAARQMGYTIDYLLTEWETRGWKSFKAEWVSNRSQAGFSRQPELDNDSTDWIDGINNLY